MKKSYENKILSGAFILAFSSVLLKVLGLIYKVPLSYMLSEEGMGYFNTAYTVYTFFYIISTAGVPKAISILISQSNEEGNKNKSEEIYKTAFKIFLSVGILITAILLIFSKLISKSVGSGNAYFSIISIAPSIIFVGVSGVIRGYFNAEIKMLPIAVSEVISGVARLAFGLIFAFITFKIGADYYLISSVTIFGTTLGALFGFLYLYIYKQKFADNKSRQKSKIHGISKNHAKKILKLTLPLSLTSLVGALSTMSDTFIIMRKLISIGYSELQAGILYGNYTTLVIPMLNLIGALISPISAVTLPLITKYSTSDRKALKNSISTSLKITSFIVFPIGVLFVLSPYQLLALVFENGGAAMSAPLLICITPGIVFMALSTILNTAIEGLGNVKVPLISLIVATCLKFLLTFILMSNSRVELLGAPIATSLSYILGFLISSIYIICKEKIKINIIGSIILPFLISCISGFVFILFLTFLFKETTVFTFLISLSVFAFMYAILSMPALLKYIKLSKSGRIAQKTKKKTIEIDEKK